MKTNLLKLAAGICFSVVTLTASAQIDVVENFDYPAGDLSGKNGGIGWLGPWDANAESNAAGIPAQGQVVAGNLYANTIGNKANISGGWSQNRYRELANPIPNEAGTTFWMGYNYEVQGEDPQYSGMTFFNGTQENGYIGSIGGFIGTGSSWPDNTFTGASSDQLGIVSVYEPHHYTLRVTMFGTGAVMSVDVWADYFGATAPLADFAEPTYQYTAWFDTSGGITQIRLAGSIDVGVVAFDGIKMATNYFQVMAPVPLDLVSLKAKSTANGNLVTWDYTSNDKVASISVLRKDAAGNFVTIASLGKDAKSFTDTNPLDGTNYYKLSSKDNDGTVTNYALIADAKGFDVAPTFFPNPSTGGVVNVVAGNGAVKSVSIYDLTGKKVASKSGAGAVSTSSLAKGVYVIEISSDKSTTKSKLVVE